MPTKVCPICNVEFQGRTRTVSHYEQVYCSKTCSGIARKNRDYTPKNISEPIEKACPTCGKTFKVMPPGATSRFYPDNRQVFCSRVCNGKARYRTGRKCKELAPTDAAYIAGFLDGEGFIILYRRDDKIAMRVGFTNTHKGVLAHIENLVGGGGYHHKPDISDKWKPASTLAVNAEFAETLLEQLIPYLVIKKDRAILAVQFQQKLRDPALNADRVWQYDLFEHFKTLNKRGPQKSQLSLQMT